MLVFPFAAASEPSKPAKRVLAGYGSRVFMENCTRVNGMDPDLGGVPPLTMTAFRKRIGLFLSRKTGGLENEFPFHRFSALDHLFLRFQFEVDFIEI